MAIKPDTLWRETMLKQFGSDEAISEEMKKRARKGASKGGQARVPKGFACLPPEQAKAISSLGGSTLRDGRVITSEDRREIVERYRQGEKMAAIARDFGLHESTISRTIKRSR